jgi:lipoyl(octanoyl) transferase
MLEAAAVGIRESGVMAPRPAALRPCEFRDLRRLGYAEAYALQRDLVERRKRGEIPDQLLIVEHPHVITMGRNSHAENLLAAPEILARAGIDFHRTDRGGDVTYHGPGQIVGYPIIDLREWKRDVVAYVRAMEEALIGALAEFGIAARRSPGATGVWVERDPASAKIAAIGVHVSRWVTSHGFALNVDTDLSYFQYIVPCGLTKPVTSMRAQGSCASCAEVVEALARSFGRVFDRAVERTANALCAVNVERTANALCAVNKDAYRPVEDL